MKREKNRWLHKALAQIDLGKPLSLDFWNTLVIEQASRSQIRTKVSHELTDHWNMQCSGIDLFEIFLRVSKGLTKLAQEVSNEREYRLYSAWCYVAHISGLEKQYIDLFAAEAVKREIQESIKCSEIIGNIEDIKSILKYENTFIVSDFEGDNQFLKEVAKGFGLDLPEQVWVSSDYVATKYTGKLFMMILNECPQYLDALHIGDNKIADYISPRRLGLNAYLFDPRTIRQPRPKLYAQSISSIPIPKPLPLPSYAGDIIGASYALREFMTVIQQKSEHFDIIIYLGSEGAFLSKLNWQRPKEIIEICLNSGRVDVLKAVSNIDPGWVISKLIEELSSVENLLKFFDPYKKDMKTVYIFNLIYEYKKKEIDNLAGKFEVESTSSYNALMNSFRNLKGKALLVDIGYRGTVAQGLTRILGPKYSQLQLFGDSTILNLHGIENFTIFPLEKGFNFIDSTFLLETLFSDGPRAPKNRDTIIEMQADIYAMCESEGQQGGLKEMRRLLFWPSARLGKALLDVTHIDDLNQKMTRNDFLPSKLYFNHYYCHLQSGRTGVLLLFVVKYCKRILTKVLK